jgi:hypothetical protein
MKGWDMAPDGAYAGRPSDPTVEFEDLLPGNWRLDFFGIDGSTVQCGTVLVEVATGESKSVFLDAHYGRGSFELRLGGSVGKARWMLSCRDGISMLPAGTWDFSGIDTLTIRGIVGVEGTFYLWPEVGKRHAVRFDLRQAQRYEL